MMPSSKEDLHFLISAAILCPFPDA
jgi:hypothetical protein